MPQKHMIQCAWGSIHEINRDCSLLGLKIQFSERCDWVVGVQLAMRKDMACLIREAPMRSGSSSPLFPSRGPLELFHSEQNSLLDLLPRGIDNRGKSSLIGRLSPTRILHAIRGFFCYHGIIYSFSSRFSGATGSESALLGVLPIRKYTGRASGTQNELFAAMTEHDGLRDKSSRRENRIQPHN